ncbi:hypothetical protein SNE40_020243 [Patella caerulea]|uniref:Apextrin C-terminal domain-containing protein n=1 Tax=Patella caerulea TaxID=87958 RepID=A0AAN8G704_PATCE
MTSSRPGLREGLIFLVLYALCISSTSAANNSNVNVFQYCQPWICSCYMDGTYYDPGETWSKKGDSCITYKCQENGYYIPDTIGVMFEGECKMVNETWTIGCFQYTVVLEGITPKYRLVQGGCMTNIGAQCILVGDRIEENCDTYECQIVGTCYTLVKVVVGCNAGSTHGCQQLHSVWNDACNVFQCLPDATTESKIQIHLPEVMLWPRGNWALLKPQTGCPSNVEEIWDEGERVHYSEGGNFYNGVNEFEMDGNHTEFVMEHRFCTHEDYLREGFMPVYHTYWEEGRYCILRFNDSCPKNFSEGYVRMADFEGNITINGEEMYVNGSVNGTLPDGEFLETSTLLYFCCRYDGDLETQLILPADKPFVLFMAENETECQKVRAMEYEKEFFSFADVFEGFERELNGSLPRISTADNNTMINLCHYKPLDCGCVYETGEYVTLGSTFTTKDGCVSYKCMYEEFVKKNILVLQTGACANNGGCIATNASVRNTEGEQCTDRFCRQRFNAAKEQFRDYWEFEEVPFGCKDTEGICQPISTEVVIGCYTVTCKEDPVDSNLKFLVTAGGCTYPNATGGCVPEGDNITDAACLTLQCQRHASMLRNEMAVLAGGCSYGTQCYSKNDVWRDDCVDYVCREFNNGSVVKYYHETTKQACADVNGTCHDVGTVVKSQCWDYQCFINQHTGQRRLSLIGGGCMHQGQCKTKDQIWNSGCSNFTCDVFHNSTLFKWSVEYLNAGCDIGNGTCIEVGANVSIGCSIYQCRKGAEECGLIAIDGQCPTFDGSCVAQNANWTSGCTTYTCNVYGDSIKLESVNGGCSWDGACRPEGSTWNESCKTYECQNVNNMYKSVMIAKGCKDPSGGCMAANEIRPYYTCNKIKCFVTDYSCRISIIEAGCNYNNKCYKANETYPDSSNPCVTYICNITYTDDGQVSMRSDKISQSCYSSSDKVCFNNTHVAKYTMPFCLKFTCDMQAPQQPQHAIICQSETGDCVDVGSRYTTVFSSHTGDTYRAKNCLCSSGGQPQNCQGGYEKL